MRKLFILFTFLLIVTVGFGQTEVNRAGPANTVKDQRLEAYLNLFIPRYNDTTAANVSKGIDTSFAVIGTRSPLAIWYRAFNPKRWVKMADTDNIGDIINGLYDSSATTISILNDSTIIICSGVDVCDTLSISTSVTNLSSVSFLDGNTIVVCAVDTTTGDIECDTLDIPEQQLYVFQNGLNSPATGIVEFGGSLIHNTEFHTEYFKQTFAGLTVYDYPYQFEQRQYFPNGTGIASFKNRGFYNQDSSLFAQSVKLGINFTGDVYTYTPDFAEGYMGDRIGYIINTNGQGYGSFGWRQDDTTAKTTGIFFHTQDTSYTDGVTLFAVPRVVSGGDNIMGGTGNLKDYKALTVHTDKVVQIQGYPNTRNDGLTQQALFTDADGNIKLGTVAGGGSTVTIFNDTTIIICSYGEYLCDTIITTVTAQTVFIANDSTLVVCAADGFTCDTLNISSGGQSFDRGFFEPDQISLGDTYHHANLNDFSLDFADSILIRSTEETAVKSHLLMDEEFAQLLSETADHKMSVTTQGLGKGTTVDIVAIEKAGNTGGWLEVGATVGVNIGSTSDATAIDEYLPHIKVASGFIQINKVGADNTADSLYSKDATGNVVLRAASTFVGGITANNGLTEDVANNVQLGGTLVKNTTIDGSTFYLNSTSSNASTTLNVANTGGGKGVSVSAVSATGGEFSSSSGTGLNANTTTGNEAFTATTNPATTNTTAAVVSLTRFTSGTAAANIGGAVDMYIENSNGVVQRSNRLIWRWTDAVEASRTSEMVIQGVNNAVTGDVLTISGLGFLKLNSITAAAASAITAANGMIVYVSDTDATFTSIGFWARENGVWVKM
jgi:hypothetical protein